MSKPIAVVRPWVREVTPPEITPIPVITLEESEDEEEITPQTIVISDDEETLDGTEFNNLVQRSIIEISDDDDTQDDSEFINISSYSYLVDGTMVTCLRN